MRAGRRTGRGLTDAAADALRRLRVAPVPVLLVGDVSWDPAWSREVPLQAESPRLGPADRERLWTTALGDARDPLSPGTCSSGPGQIGRAVALGAARRRPLDERPVDRDLLQAGARAQNAAGLERLARRIEPGVGWDDLVLADAVAAPAARAGRPGPAPRAGARPSGGCARAAAAGIGVTALFAGDSGTGKTMSAEVIAGELGLDLYTVDLATVVDKYVGETEKNLERIFTEAAGVNGVLLFDEADADVRQAQRGARRPRPLRQHRERLPAAAHGDLRRAGDPGDQPARQHRRGVHPPARLRSSTSRRRPRSCGCSCGRTASARRCRSATTSTSAFCAAAFELTGGNIRSAAITAAYLAAAADRPVGMAELIAAVEQEYRKLGRLVLEREFGRYLSLLRVIGRAARMYRSGIGRQ